MFGNNEGLLGGTPPLPPPPPAGAGPTEGGGGALWKVPVGGGHLRIPRSSRSDPHVEFGDVEIILRLLRFQRIRTHSWILKCSKNSLGVLRILTVLRTPGQPPT